MKFFIAGDSAGNMALIEQASDLGLWRQKPFYTHSDEWRESWKQVNRFSIFLTCTGIAFDLLCAVCTYPSDPNLPGLEYRQWVSQPWAHAVTFGYELIMTASNR